MRIVLLTVVLAALAAPMAHGAYTDPALEKSLKTKLTAKFSKTAPKLTFTSVKCDLPKSGATATCKAYFTDQGVKGYYHVKATIHDLGAKLTYTATSPMCLYNGKTYTAC